MGISEVSDSLTIVVSEETGNISVAIGGSLMRNLAADQLKAQLKMLQQKYEPEKKRRGLLKRRLRDAQKDNKADYE